MKMEHKIIISVFGVLFTSIVVGVFLWLIGTGKNLFESAGISMIAVGIAGSFLVIMIWGAVEGQQ